MTDCSDLEIMLDSLAETDRERAIGIVADWSVVLDQCLARWIDRNLFGRSFLCGAFAVGIARHRFAPQWPRASFRSLVAVVTGLVNPPEGVVVTLVSDLEVLAGRDSLDKVLPLIDVLGVCLLGLETSDLTADETLSLLADHDGFTRYLKRQSVMSSLSAQMFDSRGSLEDQKREWATLLALQLAELEP